MDHVTVARKGVCMTWQSTHRDQEDINQAEHDEAIFGMPSVCHATRRRMSDVKQPAPPEH